MNSQLAELVLGFRQAEERLDVLAARTPDDRWATRRDPARWSVAECVAHLNLTGRAYVPIIRRGLDEARALNGSVSRRYRRDAMGWLIARMSGPMPRIGAWRVGRVRTAAAFVPEGAQPREEVLAEFARLQQEQIALVGEADGLPIDRVQVVSPFDARVRYNLYSCLTILPGHQLRHLEQAESVWGD